jgi:broad specificity phosphatase PhoE
VILSSPFHRAIETAEPIAQKLGITIQKLDALRELNHGNFANQKNDDASRTSRDAFRADPDIKFGETGESQNEIQARMQEIVRLIQKEYTGKTVLVVTHGFPMQGLLQAFGREKMPEKYPNVGYCTTYLGPDGKEINLHRPKIDAIELVGKNGKPLQRIPEVLDVWMDSASMPYAQVHYPFENLEKMEASFPADFIAEYTGQIRAWFYVMHVLGVLVKGSPAFKNVAVTGVIN